MMLPALSATVKRGSAEFAILAVLEDQPLHGYEIGRRIEQQTGGVLYFTLASLYPLLYKFEARGWTRGTWETTAAGVKRRSYSLTAAGRKHLALSRQEWAVFFRALARLGGLNHA
jgi:PadR family transcriptional regulator PadR